MLTVAEQQKPQDQPTKVRLHRAIMLEGKRVEPGVVVVVARHVAIDIVGAKRGEILE